MRYLTLGLILALSLIIFALPAATGNHAAPAKRGPAIVEPHGLWLAMGPIYEPGGVRLAMRPNGLGLAMGPGLEPNGLGLAMGPGLEPHDLRIAMGPGLSLASFK